MKIAVLVGGSGSGKSTVLRGVRAHFKERVAVLSLDDYYKPKDELPVDDEGATNFDLPEVIDHEALLADVDRLGRGESVRLATYTYNRDVMQSEEIVIEPAEWLVVEGLFAMAYEGMRERADLVGYIDAPEIVRLSRRIARDGAERGYTEDEVRYQWRRHVRPADLAYIEPWKGEADVVIDNEHHWEEGLKSLIDQMENQAT
jgi:uridine kinase